jgi:hypothetical protein
MSKYKKVGEGKYSVHNKTKCFGQVLGSFIAVGIFSLLSTQSADALPTQSLSEADPKIYAELSQAVTEYIESRPYYWYDDAKFTEVAYQVYSIGSLTEQYEESATASLAPKDKEALRKLQKEVRHHSVKRYSLKASRTTFYQYTTGEISFDDALTQEKAHYKEKHGAKYSEDEFRKQSLVIYFQKEQQEIISKSKGNSDWTFDQFASAEIKKAKDSGFAKVTEGETVKLSTLLSEEKLRAFTKREGNEVAAADLMVKYYGHPPEVLGGYFSERLCDLLYEYIDKPGGITPASYSKLRTKILVEWNTAAGDLSKLKETCTAFKNTTSAESSPTAIASKVPASPIPTIEPTTTPAVSDPILEPVEEVEETASNLIDDTKKKLEKIKIPKLKW